MDRRVKISTVGALFAALAGSTLAGSPAIAGETKPVYVASTNAAATVNQILASGDSVAGSAQWQGIPDGMGALKNKNGTVSVFVNHELSASDPFVGKLERPYGGYGATISKVTTNAAGTAVTKIESAIKKATYFDYEAGVYGETPGAPDGAPDADSYGVPNHSTALNRFCSATLVDVSSLSATRIGYKTKNVTETRKVNVRYVIEVNGKSKTVVGKEKKKIVRTMFRKNNGQWTFKKTSSRVTFGTTDPIFLTGEEGTDESRVFGLNTRTGELVQLPQLGLGATENISVAAGTGKTTVAMIGEDGDVADSQLFLYKGKKQTAGTWYERAGLANGQQYVASISSLVNAAADINGTTKTAVNGLISNDLIARSTMDRKVVTSAVRGSDRAITATGLTILNGVATVTIANSFVAGEEVAITGLNANTLLGVDAKAVKLLTTSSSAYSFATDGIDETVTGANIVATPAANSVLITTATAHNLLEGDKVSITLAGGISGTHVVTGVAPATTGPTKFTIETAASGAITADSRVNRVLDVEFKKVNTKQSGAAQQATAKSLGTEFSRVEDATFNPANKNEFFFVTTQSDVDGKGWTGDAVGITTGSITSTGATVNSPAVKEGSATPARDGGAVWKLTYVDVSQPELGATLDLVLNGSEAPSNDTGVKLNKPDNITISNDGTVAFLQEDPGGNDHVARLLAIRLSDRKLVSVAKFDSNMFGASGTGGYLTNDEESSGVFDATKLFGGTESTFMFNAQVHPVTTLGGLNSSSAGSSFGSDPQKATATALLRPDLRTKAKKVSITAVSAPAETNSASTKDGVTTTTHTRTMVLTVDDVTGIAANDTINVVGLTRAHIGTYSVKSVDTGAKTVTVSLYSRATTDASGSTGTKYDSPALVGSSSSLFVSDPDEDLAIKDAINEGGALYTLKIASLSALFN